MTSLTLSAAIAFSATWTFSRYWCWFSGFLIRRSPREGPGPPALFWRTSTNEISFRPLHRSARRSWTWQTKYHREKTNFISKKKRPVYEKLPDLLPRKVFDFRKLNYLNKMLYAKEVVREDAALNYRNRNVSHLFSSGFELFVDPVGESLLLDVDPFSWKWRRSCFHCVRYSTLVNAFTTMYSHGTIMHWALTITLLKTHTHLIVSLGNPVRKGGSY